MANNCCFFALFKSILIDRLLAGSKKKIRLSELKLSKTRKFRDDLIKTANALILGLDTRGNVTLLNPAAEKVTGYLKSEIEGKNWFEMLIPGGKHQEILDELNHLSDEGLPRWYENKILTKNGRERIISWSHSKIRENGKTEGTILIGIDVTERKLAEGLLKESEEKYREIMESTPYIRYRTDLEGSITFVSKAIEKLTGYTVEEMMGRNMADLYLYPEKRKKILAVLDKEGHISDIEIQLKHKDGPVWWASSNSQLFTDQIGKILGVEGNPK